MVFTEAETAYLNDQLLGRLATQQRDGTLQVSPVGFHLNPDEGTIDVGGYSMSTSQKYRNVVANGRVAFVVDDLASLEPWLVRCLEIRGVAEGIPGPNAADGDPEGALIRITPHRIISFGIDGPNRGVHDMVTNIRNVSPAT